MFISSFLCAWFLYIRVLGEYYLIFSVEYFYANLIGVWGCILVWIASREMWKVRISTIICVYGVQNCAFYICVCLFVYVFSLSRTRYSVCWKSGGSFISSEHKWIESASRLNETECSWSFLSHCEAHKFSFPFCKCTAYRAADISFLKLLKPLSTFFFPKICMKWSKPYISSKLQQVHGCNELRQINVMLF